MTLGGLSRVRTVTEFNGIRVIPPGLGAPGSAGQYLVQNRQPDAAQPDTQNDVTTRYLSRMALTLAAVCASRLQVLTSTALNLISTSAVHPLPHAVTLSLFNS